MNQIVLSALLIACWIGSAGAQETPTGSGERICPQAAAAAAASEVPPAGVPGAQTTSGSGVPAPSEPDRQAKPRVEYATFGMGCFWGAEAAFCALPGVLSTQVGYAGGWTQAPSYEQVSSGRTGHAEVVQIAYDPAQITYGGLLAVFWRGHDPTTLDRQGPDVGSQYRSLILFHSPEQEAEARASLAQLARTLPRPIVTELAPAPAFYPAEGYHQRYLERRGRGRCNP